MERLSYGHVEPGELEAMHALHESCFAMPRADWDFMVEQLEPENFRVLRAGTTVVAAAGLIWMGQYFGGRSVPMSGIGALGVAPEHRGRGLASRLIKEILVELQQRNVPLSSLYPSTVQLYRRSGFGRGGARITYETDSRLIRVQEPSLDIVEATDMREVQAIYNRVAARVNGRLDRNEAMWSHMVKRPARPTRTYVATHGKAEEGYMVIHPRTNADGTKTLEVVDWCAITMAAHRRMLEFLASSSSTMRTVRWPGGPRDAFASSLPELTYSVARTKEWMLRIVNVEGALKMRGYPRTLEAELHLEIRDDMFPWNNDRFVLRVVEGRGTVQRGGRAHLRLDVRELSMLYTSNARAQELALFSDTAATDEALATADLIFGGAAPWMADDF